MKRRVIFILAVALILIGIFILVKVAAETLTPKGKGALQITTNLKAAVFLDNKPVGDTPLCLCEQNQIIPSGEHDLRIVPEDQSLDPFTAKVRINSGVLTAVERTFLPGALASSYILTLEKSTNTSPQLFIASIPEGALVTIDGESRGATPLLIESISESEHEVEIQKYGFSKKTIRVRAVPSHKLTLNVLLGTDSGQDEELQLNTTNSSEQTPTPEPILSTTRVTINNTPTGFLRVREEASTSSEEVARVNPEETYPLIDETESWFLIEYETDEQGWISRSYATKIEPQDN